jgi:uncharacterized Tic20 family protein
MSDERPYDEAPAEAGAGEVAPAADQGELTGEDKTMGMLCHLLALCGYIIPFGNILGPLIIWLVKKEESAFVNDQGKEAINFQITVMIAIIICVPLMFICIGIPLAIIVGIGSLVLTIIATVNASGGTWYRYPFALRLIK